MGNDYYSILGLKRICSKLDILNAFNKIVHEFGMNELNKDDTNRRLLAFEAYDVLSDPFWRELYDQYGDLAIKTGVLVDNKKGVKQYAYHGDIFLTYKSVYGSTNPYAHVMLMLSEMKVTPGIIKKPDVKNIHLTLKELFFGALKKITVPKSDGTRCIVNVKIPKGIPENSEITHNSTDGMSIIFVIKDLPHEHFVRSGHDLVSTYNVTVKEMMCGVQFVITTLDNKQLRVNITQVITPSYQKVIRCEGMPVYGEDGDKRGDIILKFNIQWPMYLPIENKTFCEQFSDANI